MPEWIEELLSEGGLSETIASYIANAAIIVVIMAVSFLAYFIAKKLLLKLLKMVIAKSRTKWDDTFFQHRVFEHMILVVPALVVYAAAPLSLSAQVWLQRMSVCLIVYALVLAFDKFLDAVNDIYRRYESSKTKPIRGYLQVLKIAAYIISIIIIISTLTNRSPLLLLGGIGAATAVLLLVFQNTILGFVASIQLTGNDMVRIGDWIEMSKHNADGAVTEITLHTVKVQNWDNTVSTIPTYALVSESFKNWRSMQETGGRRIKRAVNIDMASIKFCDEQMLERYKKIELIREYLERTTKEICQYNHTHNTHGIHGSASMVNGRKPTNIGIFRTYIDIYLQNHPRVHRDMFRLVRNLDPSEHGLPVEIYVFANTTKWAEYEAIQADIFDHVLAVIPEFDLRIFQSPSGYDLAHMHKTKEEQSA